MYKFRIIEGNTQPFFIGDTQLPFIRFLHSDGSVTVYPEYFGTREAAQKILDKYYPSKLKHEWEHGDIFCDINGKFLKIYIKICGKEMQVFHLEGEEGMPTNFPAKCYLDFNEVIFLFNIKDIIKEKLCQHQQ